MESRDWTRFLLPLPKRFDLVGSLACAPGTIAISCSGAGVVLDQAVAHLREVIGAPAGTRTVLTIELALVEADAADSDELMGLPNADQAYRIHMAAPDRLRVYGLQSAGVLYGALTLGQLLRPSQGQHVIEVPLIDVLDWPDLEQRGLWNFPDPDEWIPWMAGMKLNYGKMADTRNLPVVRDEPGSAVIDVELQEVGKRHAFAYVPYIVHLNFLHDIGLFSAYPELAGVGDGALAGRYFAHNQGDQHRAPCASQPVLVDLLTDWLISIADQGADEISCWLSERPCQCQCERCTPTGQFLLETRAFLAAWRRAQARHPDLLIRIFSSTTTPQQDDRVLAELPPEVRFERACATAMDRVRRQPRDRFSNPLIDEAAATGRWVASYDVPIGAFGNVDTPEFKVPQYSAQRIRDFVSQLSQRSYAGAYGMLAWGTMGRQVCGYAICALAEFSWNVGGRSISDFATAWATLENISNPQAVGTWAELLGEVEFDVYDADFPICYSWGRAAQLVENRQPPRFGEGMFRHLTEVADFGRHIERCEQAATHVEGLERPELLLATDVISSYVKLSRAIWHVSHLFAHADLRQLETQQQLAEELQRLDVAGIGNVEAIRSWRTSLGAEPWHHRVHDAIAATQDTVRRIDGHIRDNYLH